MKRRAARWCVNYIFRTAGVILWPRMKKPSQAGRFRLALERLKKLFKPEEPPAADPYAYVSAPKRPRPSTRSGAAVAEFED
jgi:hypothetical protein